MENNNKIAIIGGGQTAIYAAKEIREHDQNCLITIYSEENENQDQDFEFNQDFEIEEETRSPGWLRYQKRIK